MSNTHYPRRRLLSWALGTLGLAAAKPVLAATPTPSATEGPFYPTPTMRRAALETEQMQNSITLLGTKVASAVRDIIFSNTD